jgi:hypothetical protein
MVRIVLICFLFFVLLRGRTTGGSAYPVTAADAKVTDQGYAAQGKEVQSEEVSPQVVWESGHSQSQVR